MSFFNQEAVSVLISKEQLQTRIEELGRQIQADYEGKELTVIGVLNGCILFYSDLIRNIDLPLRCDFLGLSSYGAETKSSGVVRFTKDLSSPIQGKHVLIVEDIVDTGLTLSFLLENLKTRNPTSVRLCSLLSKPSRREVEVSIDYLGFTIEDNFVVGYGLDLDNVYRNLLYVGYFPPSS